MRHSALLVSLLMVLSASAQQPSDAAVADEYCDNLIQKWDLLFQWARAAAPDMEEGLADLDAYSEKGRRLIDNSFYPYEKAFLERAYLQAMLVAVQLATYPDREAVALTVRLKEGARAQCINGVLSTLSEVPLPPRL
jgi:hypothetical protein